MANNFGTMVNVLIPLVLVFSIIGGLPRGLRARILASLSNRESRKFTP